MKSFAWQPNFDINFALTSPATSLRLASVLVVAIVLVVTKLVSK